MNFQKVALQKKIHQYDVQLSAPWFDMENDILELSMRVRSRHEQALPSWTQIVNTNASKRKTLAGTEVQKARAVTSPRGKKAGGTVGQKSDSGAELAPWAKAAASPLQQKNKPKAKVKGTGSAAGKIT